MKKQLLFSIALGASISLFAQQKGFTTSGNVVPKLSSACPNKAVKYNPYASNEVEPASFSSIVNGKPAIVHPTPHSKAFTTTVIGSTIYDLQSNASIATRSVLNPDGTISACYTFSNTTVAGGTTDRGTGYVYFDGTTWSTAPTVRLESQRVGWPNMGVTTGTSAGAEVTLSHLANGSSHDLVMMSRPVKGTGAWTETNLGIPDTWARMVVGGANGKSIHVISETKGAAPVNPAYMGQNSALSYSRSQDGGLTWDKVRTIIPQIDSSQYVSFNGDDYNMDIKGDTIAIVIGGLAVDVILLKSVDNGTSWTKTIVYKFPMTMFDPYTMITDTNSVPDGVADSLQTNDGSVQVLLDNAGMAHVFYGNMYMIQTAADPTNGASSYYPGTDGLMYWNEYMGSAAPTMIAAAQDLNANSTLDITAYGTYYTSLTSMPSASKDAAGNIFVSYASIYEGIADDGTGVGSSTIPATGKSYRHTYVMASQDLGTTWCTPIDITDPTAGDYVEGVFGGLTRRSDANVHLIWERDSSPGDGLTGTPAGSTDPQAGASDIVYVKIPVVDLLCNVGINESTENNSFNVYPNPATDVVKLDFNLARKENISVKITNVVGQTVATMNNNTPSGVSSMDVNVANYAPGVYFVNATIGNKLVSKKLIVK